MWKLLYFMHAFPENAQQTHILHLSDIQLNFYKYSLVQYWQRFEVQVSNLFKGCSLTQDFTVMLNNIIQRVYFGLGFFDLLIIQTKFQRLK